jgi:hypothetical protein
MMVVVSEKDELVPKEMGQELWEASGGAGQDITKRPNGNDSDRFGRQVIIRDALHENAWKRRQWLKEMTQYIAEVRRRP